MRAQYAMEAMLIAAVFFVLISLFAGLYMELSKAERSAIGRNGLKSGLSLVASRVDSAYFLGDGNEFLATLPPGSALSYADGNLTLTGNGESVSKKVLAKVVLHDPQRNLRIRNVNGTVFIEEA